MASHSVGSGDQVVRQRLREITGILNEILDPCSVAAGANIGLVDMGIVERIECDGEVANIDVFPTFPTCRFVPIFEDEIVRRVSALDWCGAVNVRVVERDTLWNESRLSAEARKRLDARRKAFGTRPSMAKDGRHSHLDGTGVGR